MAGILDQIFKSPSKKKKINSKQNKQQKKIDKSTQDCIPYVAVYKNGIIENKPGTFSKSYKLHDVNFLTATDQEQVDYLIEFGDLINSFGWEIKAQFTIYNQSIEPDKVKKDILLPLQRDNYNDFREEMNSVINNSITDGNNCIDGIKLMTIAVDAADIDSAVGVFNRIEGTIEPLLKKLTQEPLAPCTIEERLDIMHSMLNNQHSLLQEKLDVNHPGYTLEDLAATGLTSKDAIAPSSLVFNKDHIIFDGERYARALYIREFPAALSTEVVYDMTHLPMNLVCSMCYESLKQEDALKFIRNKQININDSIMKAQKVASRSGYSAELLPPKLKEAKEEADSIRNDITGRNQKMFLVSITLMIYADSLEELDKNTEELKMAISKTLCRLGVLTYQQKLALQTVLPLCNNKLSVSRMLSTESASVFIPFATENLIQPGGKMYGVNARTKNLIMYNRLKSSNNANGFILGTPGSGKSFAAKLELIYSVIQNTDSDIFIVDPEGEYTPIVNALGGQEILIAAGSNVYLNPLDMDMKYAETDKVSNVDPIALKTSYIQSIFETVIGGRFGLSPIQKSIIGRCVKKIYRPYIEYMNSPEVIKRGITCDTSQSPTLEHLYEELMIQDEPEAKGLALGIEQYAIGALNTFAKRTFIPVFNNNSADESVYGSKQMIRNRIISYNLRDIGKGLKELGSLVCLNDIWNRIIENSKSGRFTHLYIDEFHLFSATESTASFVDELYRRARKWGGIPTGITQNVDAMLGSQATRTMLSNCDFLLLLKQSPTDGAELSKMFKISDTLMEYVTNSQPGQGLMYTGKSIVPFINNFPKDTQIYKLISTNPNEKNKAGDEMEIYQTQQTVYSEADMEEINDAGKYAAY